jgi:hypothetical protein
VTTKNSIFWDVTPCGSCKNRSFGGTFRLHYQVDKKLRGVLQLLVSANVIPSSPILVTLMMEAIRFSETSVLTRATQRNFPEDGILQSWRRITKTLQGDERRFDRKLQWEMKLFHCAFSLQSSLGIPRAWGNRAMVVTVRSHFVGGAICLHVREEDGI